MISQIVPTPAVPAAAHVVEALYSVQAARRALAQGRAALGPVAGVHELWERLDSLVGTVDGLLAELQALGQGGLAMHKSHSGTGCGICAPTVDQPTYTRGRR